MKHHVSLTEFKSSHLPLLQSWLHQPHVRKWYPEPESNVEWALHPPNTGAHALIQVGEKPIGYIRWQLVPREVLDSIGLKQVPGNSADIDLLIGDENHLTIGAGSMALSLLEAYLTKQGNVPMLALTSSRENKIAHKAFIKAGYEKIAEHSPDGYGDCFLFALALDQ